MIQEINIDITLIIEADVDRTQNDFENFVRKILTGAQDSETLSLNKYHINRIREEVEIYAPDPTQDDGVWKFVEEYYPKYYSCSEIRRNEDLCKIAEGELDGDAAKMFIEEFGENLELATAAFDQSTKYIYERAILGYQREQRGRISIVWSTGDVEMRAKDKGYLLRDGEAQKVLDMVKDRHDCNIGITWDVIDDYLSYIAPDSLEDDGVVWVSIQFHGREYLGREIPDLNDRDFTLTVAPISLSHAMNLDANGNGTPGATLKDGLIAYYATEEELKLSNAELFRLIYA